MNDITELELALLREDVDTLKSFIRWINPYQNITGLMIAMKAKFNYGDMPACILRTEQLFQMKD